MLAPLLLGASSAAGSVGCSGECRRPWYHYTARNMTTSDPNGLQWRRRTADGAVSYEFFHQDRGSYTQNFPRYCWGNEGAGDAWGHASSPDMLRWKSMPVSGVCASTGAGVTLPEDFRGPNGERWLSAMIGSSPGGDKDPRGSDGVGWGLKLWTSNDSNVAHFDEYLPPGTTFNATYHDNDACVICPAGVRKGPSNPPPWTRINVMDTPRSGATRPGTTPPPTERIMLSPASRSAPTSLASPPCGAGLCSTDQRSQPSGPPRTWWTGGSSRSTTTARWTIQVLQ